MVKQRRNGASVAPVKSRITDDGLTEFCSNPRPDHLNKFFMGKIEKAYAQIVPQAKAEFSELSDEGQSTDQIHTTTTTRSKGSRSEKNQNKNIKAYVKKLDEIHNAKCFDKVIEIVKKDIGFDNRIEMINKIGFYCCKKEFEDSEEKRPGFFSDKPLKIKRKCLFGQPLEEVDNFLCKKPKHTNRVVNFIKKVIHYYKRSEMITEKTRGIYWNHPYNQKHSEENVDEFLQNKE